MTYYPTLAEDLARAKEILKEGKVHEGDLEFGGFPYVKDAPIVGATIYGKDIYAAYKLLESFVEQVERLQHSLNNCELHKGMEGIQERTGCALCLTEVGNDLIALHDLLGTDGDQDDALQAIRGLKQRVKFTEDYEDLKFRLEGLEK